MWQVLPEHAVAVVRETTSHTVRHARAAILAVTVSVPDDGRGTRITWRVPLH